jgi:transcriptional regulator with XRE-family HTH domain
MAASGHWWDVYGPFDPDEDGYPHAGQVVRHYRLLKNWSPAELGEAMGKTARWVQAMEHDNTVPEAISRRRALAAILGIPPVLLGLAQLEAFSKLLTETAGGTSRTAKIDQAALDQYQGFLRLYWELDYTSSAAESLEDIARWTRHLRAVANETDGTQRRHVVELLCRYDQLATWIARDQRDYPRAFAHANRAVKLANTSQNPELLAAALFRRGRTYLESGDIASAVDDLDAALPFAHRARPQLKALVLLAAGHAHAHAAESSADRIAAVSLLDQASRIIRRGNLEDDESFVKLNTGRYHLDRAGALIAMRRPEDAHDELDLAERGIGPDQTRRHAYISVLRARAYAALGETQVAVSTAESALVVSKALHSSINISRIAELHQQVSATSFGTSPQVARLGALLSQR